MAWCGIPNSSLVPPQLTVNRQLTNMNAYLGDFLMGAITLGWFVAALFFVRFWRQTRDRLFLLFAVSFVILAVTRIVMVIMNPEGEDRKSTRLNSSHGYISYAVFCLKKKKKK